jgi:exopolysaccharide biosynthesis predicted pyruvyltransferase EpsI
MTGQCGIIDYAFQMAGLAMSKNFESRIKKLEVKNQVNQKPVAVLIYRDSQTLEQAKAEYKEKHGFQLPDHAKIIKICRIDASRNASIKV